MQAAYGVTLTWTGGGDGQSFNQLANWSGTPTGGFINSSNLVDTYVVDTATGVITSSTTIAFRAGGGLIQSAGSLSILNGNGVGVLETPDSIGSITISNGELSTQYLAELEVSLGQGALLTLSGSGNPVNESVVDISDLSASIHFLAESSANVLSEHLNKFTVFGSSPVVGVNLSVTDDGSGGALVAPLLVEPPSVKLQVDRDSGEMTLVNLTGGDISFYEYDIISIAGSLDAAAWTPIAESTDAVSNGGDGSVDADDAWIRFSAPGSRTDLAEGTFGELTLANNAELQLGNAWITSPFEELEATLSLTNGSYLSVEVVYLGTEILAPIQVGDFNADGRISADDWPLLRSNLFASVSSLLPVDAHAAGDLDGSGTVDEYDFLLFEELYDATLGPGAFARMASGVPEPSSVCTILVGSIVVLSSMSRRLTPSTSCRS